MFMRPICPPFQTYPVLPYGGLSILSGNTFTAGNVTATVTNSSDVAVNVNVQGGNSVIIGGGFPW